MNRVLIIEDESVIRNQLVVLLERHNYVVTGVSSLDEALQHKPQSFNVILADIRLPGKDGNQILKHSGDVPVIMMTSYATVRSATDSMRFGAVDYISKPFDHGDLLAALAKAQRNIRAISQNTALRNDLDRKYPQHEITSSNLKMQDTISRVSNLSPENIFVYLHGERGTGKELLARKCHANSDRRAGPLLFAELPGHDSKDLEALVFGAYSEYPNGLLHAAHRGTLVVRRIGDLNLDKQEHLLSLILGSRKHRQAPDVRLLVLAIDSLDEAVDNGTLHPLLGEQFGDSNFPLVPLRERREDISQLSAHYLRLSNKRYHKHRITFSIEAMHALESYGWPGNICELKSVVERAVLMVDSGEIKPAHLGVNVINKESIQNGSDLSLDTYFRHFVLNFEGRLSETELASKLGISRKALWQRRQKMGLTRTA